MSENLRRMGEILDHLERVQTVLDEARAGAAAAGPITPENLETAIDSMRAARILAQRVVDAERQVEVLQAMTRAVLDASLHAIIIVDAHERIIAWSGSAERLYGFSEADVIGHPLSSLIVPARYRERHRTAFARLVATQRSSGILRHVFRAPALRADGPEFVAEFLIVPMESNGLFTCISFSRDSSVPQEVASPHIDVLVDHE
jgi:PAS domain S-box-containing protein